MRTDSARPDSARGVKRRLTSRRNDGVLGRVHVQERGRRHGPALVRRGSLTSAPRPEQKRGRVAAEVPDVLVAGEHPESGLALVHGLLGAQSGQHVVVVVTQEERRVPRVDALVRSMTEAYCAAIARRSPREHRRQRGGPP